MRFKDHDRVTYWLDCRYSIDRYHNTSGKTNTNLHDLDCRYSIDRYQKISGKTNTNPAATTSNLTSLRFKYH